MSKTTDATVLAKLISIEKKQNIIIAHNTVIMGLVSKLVAKHLGRDEEQLVSSLREQIEKISSELDSIE